MEGAGTPVLDELRHEIRRVHGCASEFERFVTLPEVPGRGRRTIAVFTLPNHAACHCYAWLEPLGQGVEYFVVLHGIDVSGPEEALQHVALTERAASERWAQEYA
jgi:hypothetical protein